MNTVLNLSQVQIELATSKDQPCQLKEGLGARVADLVAL